MQKLIEKQERLSGHISRAVETLKWIGQANITLGVIETKAAVVETKWQAFQETHELIEDSAISEEKKKMPYFVQDVYPNTEDAYATNRGKLLDYI